MVSATPLQQQMAQPTGQPATTQSRSDTQGNAAAPDVNALTFTTRSVATPIRFRGGTCARRRPRRYESARQSLAIAHDFIIVLTRDRVTSFLAFGIVY
jgi:hypothetical protein